MLTPLAIALLLQVQPPHGQPPVTTQRADSYLDAAARETVMRARAYRERVDRSITRYEAVSRERISLGLTALRRERLFFRRETAARIDWQRDGITRIEVLGARQVIPVAFADVRIADDADAVTQHAFDPADDRLFLGMMDSSFVYHPFAEDGDTHYRFGSGDTTAIRLPDGRTVRLYAIEVQPRIQDVHHFIGTVWVDADSYAMVRAVFRLADAFDLGRDGEDDDADDIPGFLKPIQAEVKYFTVEYGLWELRWWLPRLVAFEAVASVGGFARAPLRYERTYTDYRVEGDPDAPTIARTALAEPDADSAMVACFARGYCRCNDSGCSNLSVVMPDDTLTLLHSPYLPESIYAQDETLMSSTELRELADHLEGAIPEAPWQLTRPTFAWGLGGSGLVRYNRVEGISVGARTGVDFGRLQADAVARIGLAELEPEVEIGITREQNLRQLRLAGYRRLSAMNPAARPLGIGNSVGALLFGDDDGEYQRALGVQLTGRPAPATGSNAYDWRIYAERQRAVDAETDFSLRHALDGDHVFRPALAAARADQLGAHIVLRRARGLDPAGFRWGAELDVEGATGTFDFARSALTLRAGTPLPGGWVGSLEVAGGTSTGDVPVQSAFFLGGPATVRGYHGAAAYGSAFWRGRAEVGTSFPAARLTLFGDAGWAGDRQDRRLSPQLVSAGIGGSFLDGLVRIDLARALERPTGWRLHFYVDGVL
jgi:hypothetical protein